MKIKRRTFIASSFCSTFGLGLASSAAPAFAAQTIKGKKLSKAELPTPALLVDLDMFEANLTKMAGHCKQAGCGFRPHAKTHKCPEIARRQISAGAKGICVATVPEAEAMVKAGIPGVLLTSPIVEPGKIERMVKLAATGKRVMLSVGHALEAERLADAARRKPMTVDVLIDVDVGDHRTGVLPGEPALRLAELIGKSKSLRLRGLQAYSGSATHVVGFPARERASRAALAKALETRELLIKAGFELEILSGGSTGTYNIDPGVGLTELQVGSFIFMDVNYRVIGGKDGNAIYSDFQPSLTVLTTVVNTNYSDHVSVDAGTKAFSSDSVDKPESKGWSGLAYRRLGDEFGALTASDGGKLPRLGDRLEFIVPHCDPTVNLYDRIYAMRGDFVEAIWPIAARKEFGNGV